MEIDPMEDTPAQDAWNDLVTEVDERGGFTAIEQDDPFAKRVYFAMVASIRENPDDDLCIDDDELTCLCAAARKSREQILSDVRPRAIRAVPPAAKLHANQSPPLGVFNREAAETAYEGIVAIVSRGELPDISNAAVDELLAVLGRSMAELQADIGAATTSRTTRDLHLMFASARARAEELLHNEWRAAGEWCPERDDQDY
jgi:hypothetical protein